MHITVHFIVNDCELEAEADFETEYERPDPQGDNRGGWGATLTALHMGGLVLSRAQAVQMAGQVAVEDMENTASWCAMEAA